MSNVIVTGIIPVHNRENWVQQSILSFINQTYPNRRLVVIDDGSTDSSWNKITELISNIQYSQIPEGNEPAELLIGEIQGIQVIAARFKTGRGPSAARNYGIQTGWEGTDLFAMLDSDDWMREDRLEKTVDAYEQCPEYIGVICSDFTAVDPYKGSQQRQYKEPYSLKRLGQECIIASPATVSKKCFEKFGLFDESLRCVEDYDRWLAFCKNFIFVHLPFNLTYMRVGEHSSTDTVKKEIWEDCYRRVMQKYSK